MRLNFSVLSSSAALAVILSTAAAEAQTAGVAPPPAPVPISAGDEDDGLEPRGNLWELGIFGGVLFMSERNALHEADKPFANFKIPSPEVGVRIAYFPLSFLGLEGEFMAAAGELKEEDESATVWAGRGHLILQVPTRVVVPFALIGGGRMGIISDTPGNDNDPELHFGAGLKFNLHRKIALRLDGRDTITKQRPEADTAHNFEAVLGLSVVLGRPSPRPKDSDGDNVVDLQDLCPLEPGLLPDGCPIRDSDADGIPDPKDQCPAEAGVAPTGCPDGDKDGILDRDDKCLTEPGVAPDGCPPDSDGDGFVDPKDKCPNEPENKNGFEDDDGCPDEIPAEVKRFTGVIKGIEFENGKSAIRSVSRPLLDEAAGILNQHPTLKVMIVGHTDNVGSRAFNHTLSEKRAAAVKAYLAERGVDPERILTHGDGPDSPIASNKTRAGRAQNRRIEFTIIK
jgi:outer membrane protein OmpA-like peptidoglycan-associated protein